MLRGRLIAQKSRPNDMLLIVPVTTFCLGCWQWRRHLWKTNLLKEIREEMKMPPVEFPVDSLADLDKLEYRRVHVRGTYLFDRQFSIKWRSRLDEKQSEVGVRRAKVGSQIITPLRLEGTNLVIMVNRGWLPIEKEEAELVRGKKREPRDVELNGVVRKSERPNWLLNNHPEKGIWVYKDLNRMARECGAAPILVDAEDESGHSQDEPIGGQTNANLRNEHFNYMQQWFTLSAVTITIWCLQYHRRGGKKIKWGGQVQSGVCKLEDKRFQK